MNSSNELALKIVRLGVNRKDTVKRVCHLRTHSRHEKCEIAQALLGPLSNPPKLSTAKPIAHLTMQIFNPRCEVLLAAFGVPLEILKNEHH